MTKRVGLTFSEALEFVKQKQGCKIWREHWVIAVRLSVDRYPQIWVELTEFSGRFPDALCLRTNSGACLHWTPSPRDLLADDWIAVVKECVNKVESQDEDDFDFSDDD